MDQQPNVVALDRFRGQKQAVDSKPDYKPDSQSLSERRGGDRRKFSRMDHPMIFVDGVALRLKDISPTGARFVCAPSIRLEEDAVLDVRLLLDHCKPQWVRAQVVRMVGDLVALKFFETAVLPDA